MSRAERHGHGDDQAEHDDWGKGAAGHQRERSQPRDRQWCYECKDYVAR